MRKAETSLDLFLHGKLQLRQPKSGHRMGTDAILLAAAALPEPGIVADLGAGAGAVGISAISKQPESSLLLVDIDAEICALAAENLARNDLSARGRVIQADLFAGARLREAAGLLPRTVDQVLTNPPFANTHEGRISPNERRRQAHIMQNGTLADWLRAATHLLKPGGHLVMIHRADALQEILKATERRFGGLKLIFIQPGAADCASRLLLCAKMGSRGPASILPPLILHEPILPERSTNRFTSEAEALHRGQARIDWEKGGIRYF